MVVWGTLKGTSGGEWIGPMPKADLSRSGEPTVIASRLVPP